MAWNDLRLNFSDCNGLVDPSTMNEIWLPQPYLHRLSAIHERNQVTRNSFLFEASPKDGFRWWIETIVVIQCRFDFTFYPFDKQRCSVKFTSNTFDENAVKYFSWGLSKSPYGVDYDLMYSVDYTIMTAEEDLSFSDDTDTYSACGFFIDLERYFTPAIINHFMPSLFIVIIAFFG